MRNFYRKNQGKFKFAILTLLLAAPLLASIVDLTPGKEMFHKGQFEKAKVFFSKAMVLDPSDPEIYLYLGYSYLGLGRADSAIYYAEKGLALNPQSVNFQFLKLTALMQVKKFKEAISLADGIYSSHPDDSLSKVAIFEAYFNYGGWLYTHGQKDSALSCFKKALRINPGNPSVYSNIAVIFYEKGQLDSSSKYVERGLTLYPFDPQLLKAKAQILTRQNRLKELKDVLGMLVTVEPQNLDLWLKYALVYRATSKVDSAIAIYQKLMEDYPDSFKVYEQYAGLYEGIFNYPKVREIYSAYLKRHPQSIKAILKVAKTFESERKYDSALVYYKRALELSPHDFNTRVKVPELLAKAGRKSAAITEYKKLISEYPHRIELWKEVGELIEEAPDSGLSFYKKMLTEFPVSPFPCARMGLIYYGKSEVDSARTCLEKAVELKTDEPEVYYNLAKIYFGSGEKNRGSLVIKIAFRNLTGKIATLGRILESTNNILDLQKHEKDIKTLKTTNDYLEKMLILLSENVPDSEYFQFLKSLESRYPRSFLVLRSLTNYYLSHDDTQRAVFYATKLVEVNPSIAENHYLRGKVLIRAKRCNEAYMEFNRAFAAGETSPEFAWDFIKLGEKIGKLNETVDKLRSIDDPEVKKILIKFDTPKNGEARRGK